MNLSPTKVFPALISGLLAAFALLAAGCYYPTDGGPGYSTGRRTVAGPAVVVPTALVIVMDGGSTEADYRSWRSTIIDYLIERGYIISESELVSDPANADRIIRAIVSGGGYTLSVFNQNSAAVPARDLEDTDILYPADPYFILGFMYLDEIGPRRLPPRPPGYHPHPRPPHAGPPPGFPTYDHDHHWSRPGQSNHNNNHAAPPSDRRHREDNNPQTAQPPPPATNRQSEDHGPSRWDNQGKPPASQPPQGRDHARTDQDGHATPPAPLPNNPDHPPAHDSGRPPARSDAPATTPPKRPDRSQSRPSDRPAPSPAPVTPPAPPASNDKAGSSDRNTSTDNGPTRKPQQN